MNMEVNEINYKKIYNVAECAGITNFDMTDGANRLDVYTKIKNWINSDNELKNLFTAEVVTLNESNQYLSLIHISVTAVWEIASDFTAEAGCFDVQLRLEGGGKVWLSDVMLLIVSESTDGEQTAENIKIYGDYIMPDSLMRIPDRIMLDMITEKIEEGE